MKITFIAVAGPSGSGKTTIAREIQKHYGDDRCLTISSDNYYNDLSHLSQKARDNINFDHPDSLDFEHLAQHLQQLKQGKSINMPIYDFATHVRQQQTVRISPQPIIILEGILILHPSCLTRLYDTKIFVDADTDLCLVRRLRRDITERGRNMENILTQYTEHVKPMFHAFVEPCKASADLVINTSDAYDITPVFTSIDDKTKAAQRIGLNIFAPPHTMTQQAELYQGNYTYWT